MRFLIITGLSGSGKTVVSRLLEDMGYYCMDNLPAKLIPGFVDLWTRREVAIEKVALVVDIREEGFSSEFPRVLKAIREKVRPYVLFLEASDDVLIKRFSETRRPHPLAPRKSLREGIVQERKQLQVVRDLADEIIDTSATKIADLRDFIVTHLLRGRGLKLQIVVVSFGYKYGIPLDSDLVFDTRFLPNPHYIDTLREKTGRSQKVKDYVLQTRETQAYLRRLNRFVEYLIPKFEREGKSYLTISIGCTGGKHRSVVLAEALRAHLRSLSYRIRVYHRDIYK
ncbi:MAG: RNase adapter RapZ [Candidatus Aminicenantales bacterium]